MGDQGKRVGVVFGGPSAEHEVSGASALAVVCGLLEHGLEPGVKTGDR